MTGKNKGSHDQGYGSAAAPASTGQQTPRVPLWQRPSIPADDPIYKAGFGVGIKKPVFTRLKPTMSREQIKRNLIAVLERSGFTVQPSPKKSDEGDAS